MTNRSTRGALLALMCIGMFLVQLDVTVVNVALVSIGEQLDTGTAGLQAIVDGYTVALAAMLLPGGLLTDRLGTRRVVLIGLAGLLITSLGAGLAPNIEMLITARVLQGVAAAILLPSTLAVINQNFTDKADKARAIGIWAGVSALALPAGPLVGGLLTEHGGWRWIFLINVPIVAAALIGCRRLLPHTAGRRTGTINITNMIALGGALTVVVAAAIAAGQGQWTTTAMASIAAVTLIVAAVVLEARSPDPIVPAPLRGSKDFRTATAVSAAMNFVGIGMVFVFSLYLQTIVGDSPLNAGIKMLPLFIPLAVCAPLTGRLAAKVGPRPPIVAGLLVGILGCIAIATTTVTSPYLQMAAGMFGIGLGMGLLTPSVVALAMQSSPADLSGIASGINNTARQAASAVGVATFGALVGVSSSPAGFVHGLRVCAIMSVAVWVLAVALVVVRRMPSSTKEPLVSK